MDRCKVKSRAWVLVALFLGAACPAAEVSLTWTPPPYNEDGSPLRDLAGYTVRYGEASDPFKHQVRVGLTPRVTLGGLEPGRTYYVVVEAFNQWSCSSQPSAPLAVTLAAPGSNGCLMMVL